MGVTNWTETDPTSGRDRALTTLEQFGADAIFEEGYNDDWFH